MSRGLTFGQAILRAAPTATAPWTLQLSTLANFTIPSGYAQGVGFQIFRQPVRSSVPGLQLTGSVVIDLIGFGIGVGGNWGSPLTFDPFFTYTPSGNLDLVSFSNLKFSHPTGPLYFLIGRRELMLTCI